MYCKSIEVYFSKVPKMTIFIIFDAFDVSSYKFTEGVYQLFHDQACGMAYTILNKNVKNRRCYDRGYRVHHAWMVYSMAAAPGMAHPEARYPGIPAAAPATPDSNQVPEGAGSSRSTAVAAGRCSFFPVPLPSMLRNPSGFLWYP